MGAILLLVAILILVYMPHGDRQRPEPNLSSYYSGPMRNKKNPNLWVTDEGKIVDPPPGSALVTPKPKAPPESAIVVPKSKAPHGSAIIAPKPKAPPGQ